MLLPRTILTLLLLLFTGPGHSGQQLYMHLDAAYFNLVHMYSISAPPYGKGNVVHQRLFESNLITDYEIQFHLHKYTCAVSATQVCVDDGLLSIRFIKLLCR